MKFTKQTVAALVRPADKDEHAEWDDELPAFGVRLRGNSKTWCCTYRVNGKSRRESLGDVRKISLEDARKIARQRFAQVELGVDPGAERARASVQALTFEVAIGRYLEARQDRLRPNTLKAARRYFLDHMKPLHRRPLADIKRADVAGLLQELVKAHGPVSAARARNNISALFGWAMKEGLCESNPVIATNDPSAGIPSRDRVLNDAEIRAIWNASGDDDFGKIVRLLLLTGCRRDEIGALRWDEVNLDTGAMIIPGTRTKNHRALEQKLPDMAIDTLRAQPRRQSDYVFGHRRNGFATWSFSVVKLNARIVEAEGKPLAPWRLHDLRRTMRSNLGRLGIRPDVAEMCINHVKGGVEAIYDRHRYQREIGAALALWADRVLAIVEGRESNVTVLHSA
jgi:integrase